MHRVEKTSRKDSAVRSQTYSFAPNAHPLTLQRNVDGANQNPNIVARYGHTLADIPIFPPGTETQREERLPIRQGSGITATLSSIDKAGVNSTSRKSLSLQHNNVIQRVANPKDLARGTTPADNAIVPDLPDLLARQLETACQSSSQAARIQALRDIELYLRAKNLIDVDVVRISYDPVSTSYGLTDVEDATDPTNPLTNIKISKLAFDAGAPVVYSTIRHELIHAEQLKGVENKPGGNTDPDTADAVNYEDRTRITQMSAPPPKRRKGVSSSSSRKTTSTDRVRVALQEIETHVWEIEQSAETGATTNVPFMQSRVKALDDNYQTLCLNAVAITKPQTRNRWRDYIRRAKADAERVLAANAALYPPGQTYHQLAIPWA